MENKIWNNIRCIPGSDGNVFKYVFEKDNAVAEAVLYKYPTFEERTVVCCSTQSGCPIGCRFCGAGDSFVRSLTADEIVTQTQHLFFDKKINSDAVDRMQIMFMSMGEPLLNLKELDTAIRRLNVLYPKAALLISTSAPEVDYQPLVELSKDISKVGLQFSVHESTDEARNNLVPFKKKLSLAQIAEVGSYWAHQVGRQPFFNYCAHEKNSSVEDADRLLKLFDPSIWQATISVVCERDEEVSVAVERQRSLAEGFETLLLERGFSTRVFDPAGQNQGGGCGQLFYYQRWLIENPTLVKPSVGKKLPIIHSPR